MFEVLPVVLLIGPFAGLAADKMPRRRLMVSGGTYEVGGCHGPGGEHHARWLRPVEHSSHRPNRRVRSSLRAVSSKTSTTIAMVLNRSPVVRGVAFCAGVVRALQRHVGDAQMVLTARHFGLPGSAHSAGSIRPVGPPAWCLSCAAVADTEAMKTRSSGGGSGVRWARDFDMPVYPDRA